MSIKINWCKNFDCTYPLSSLLHEFSLNSDINSNRIDFFILKFAQLQKFFENNLWEV